MNSAEINFVVFGSNPECWFLKISVLNVSVGNICVFKISTFHKTNLSIFRYELVFFYTRFEDIVIRKLKLILIPSGI